MSENSRAAEFLSEEHAGSDEVGKEWDQDNQQWWDWYMSLAENTPSDSPLINLPKSPAAVDPSYEQFVAELAEPMVVSSAQVELFQRDGYLKLKHVLSAGTLAKLRSELTRLFGEAGDGVGNRFGSLEMMWQHSRVIEAFVFSPRLARLAADLLGVAAVRLYHDNGMSKQPGCGRTPWHYDGHHFPIATDNVCTVWAPLQAIPDQMGPLGFAKGLGLVEALEDIPFNKFDTSYDRRIIKRFAETAVEVDISAFDIGEVSFHHNLNFHTAGPNRTTTQRMVLATTYFEDGARVIDSPHMVNGDWRQFMPGVEPGQVIDTPLNPVLYRR